MLTKPLNNLHVYIDAQYNTDTLSRLRVYLRPAGTRMIS